MNHNDIKLSQPEFIEVLVALRQSVDRNRALAEGALKYERAKVAAEWTAAADLAQSLYDRFSNADQIIVRTFTE